MLFKSTCKTESAGTTPDREALIAFVHIPKTAGITLYSIIAHAYSADQVQKIMMRGMSLRIPRAMIIPKPLISFSKIRRLKAAIKDGNTLRLIRGHFDMSLGKVLPADTRFFTLLRDPVERAISHYYHFRRQTTDPIHTLALQSSLEEWVSARGLVEMDNGQVRRLAGAMNLPFGRVTAELLDRAKMNLAERFAVVGLTERFDASQVLLHRAFGWPLERFSAQNVGSNRPPRSRISDETLEVLQKFNRFDSELYRFGTAIFDKALRQFDAAGDLDRLRASPANLDGAP